MTDIKLNLGCSVFKLPSFINIDIDPKVNPDLLIDLRHLENNFAPSSVDFIYAGHIFEHFSYEDAVLIMRQCYKILKPLRNFIIVSPDYTKCSGLSEEIIDKVVLAYGEHKITLSARRLSVMLNISGFTFVQEVTDLRQIPFLVVPDIRDPHPEPWQTAILACKTL